MMAFGHMFPNYITFLLQCVLAEWCGKECCAGPYDVCYDSNNDGSCDKCCPLSECMAAQKLAAPSLKCM